MCVCFSGPLLPCSTATTFAIPKIQQVSFPVIQVTNEQQMLGLYREMCGGKEREGKTKGGLALIRPRGPSPPSFL